VCTLYFSEHISLIISSPVATPSPSSTLFTTDLGLNNYFDFILTSEGSKSAKPQKGIFDNALQKARVSSPAAAFHVSNDIDTDLVGAAAAGWTPMRYNEWFDNEFPDWFDTDTAERAEEGALRRQELMWWGRRDTSRGLDWVEIWGLDDVLTLFGFPSEDSKPVATTYVRGFRDD
jgi:FMN phosphatase YigB (HAD superfamily)